MWDKFYASVGSYIYKLVWYVLVLWIGIVLIPIGIRIQHFYFDAYPDLTLSFAHDGKSEKIDFFT